MLLRVLTSSIVLCLLSAPSAATSDAAETSSDEFVQLVVKLLGEKDKEFRAAALEQVRSAAKGPAFTRLFTAQLPKLDAEGQVALLDALAKRGDVVALPPVLELLASSRDESVRAAAIRALGSLGGPDELPHLIKVLEAGSAIEQAAARQSLAQLSGNTINEALAAESRSAPPKVKAALIEALAIRRASDQLPALVTATVDENARVRRSAMTALGQIGRPEQIAQVLPGVLKSRPGFERMNAEMNVALICSRIEDEDQRAAALIQALETVDVAQRDQLLSLVGRVGGKKLIHFVAEIATGGDASRRQLGIDALSKWPDASVADKLLEIVNRASDPAERSQAFQGYVRVCARRDNRSDKQRLDHLKQAMTVAKTPEEVTLVINRIRTAYHIDSLRFVLPYVDQPQFAPIACETIVEIAHHREVRDPNKAEVDKALDKVIQVSKDAVVIDRANRYKRGETWQRPTAK